MADDKRGGAFDNPLILYSEHKRVLDSAIKRGDEREKEAARRGFYKGLADASLLTVLVAIIAAIAGFDFGLSVTPDYDRSNVCVPLYDNTGYERCQ